MLLIPSGHHASIHVPDRAGNPARIVAQQEINHRIVDLIERDIRRPGEMERSVEGLTAKVLNDCLRTLISYGVLDKQSYPEVPPRVEYRFTAFGLKFVEIFKMLDSLEASLVRAEQKVEGSLQGRPPDRITGYNR